MPETREDAWERERLLESLEAYRRGLSDAPLLRKWSGGQAGAADRPSQSGGSAGRYSCRNSRGSANTGATGYQSEYHVGNQVGNHVRNQVGNQGDAAENRPMTFVISSEEVDRHGDVILAEGWRLAAYQRNPVFLWAHDYTRPVIGRAVSVWPEPEQLLARMEFAPTDFAREVAALYRNGYQQGVSVGFKPLRYEERRQEKTGAFLGIRFLEQELLEVSAVPVPANRSALRRAMEQAPRVGDYLYRAGGRYLDEPDPSAGRRIEVEPGEPGPGLEGEAGLPRPGLAEVLAALRLASS